MVAADPNKMDRRAATLANNIVELLKRLIQITSLALRKDSVFWADLPSRCSWILFGSDGHQAEKRIGNECG
jgi:hypothetical protein